MAKKNWIRISCFTNRKYVGFIFINIQKNLLVGKMTVDPSVLSSETMTLTARQFEAVRARVNTLTATMRRRMEQTTRTDVREVFSSSLLSPTHQLGVSIIHVHYQFVIVGVYWISLCQ